MACISQLLHGVTRSLYSTKALYHVSAAAKKIKPGSWLCFFHFSLAFPCHINLDIMGRDGRPQIELSMHDMDRWICRWLFSSETVYVCGKSKWGGLLPLISLNIHIRKCPRVMVVPEMDPLKFNYEYSKRIHWSRTSGRISPAGKRVNHPAIAVVNPFCRSGSKCHICRPWLNTTASAVPSSSFLGMI